jgi:hypothetical protein
MLAFVVRYIHDLAVVIPHAYSELVMAKQKTIHVIRGLNGKHMRSFHGLSFHDILDSCISPGRMIAFMLFIVLHTILTFLYRYSK